jgi:hypothetical protein
MSDDFFLILPPVLFLAGVIGVGAVLFFGAAWIQKKLAEDYSKYSFVRFMSPASLEFQLTRQVRLALQGMGILIMALGTFFLVSVILSGE